MRVAYIAAILSAIILGCAMDPAETPQPGATETATTAPTEIPEPTPTRTVEPAPTTAPLPTKAPEVTAAATSPPPRPDAEGNLQAGSGRGPEPACLAHGGSVAGGEPGAPGRRNHSGD